MLTATYTLVALSVEQASLRLNLLAFQKYIHGTLRQQNSMTLGQLEYACDGLNRLYEACHWRKIDIYLIPALRQLTGQADRLLDELNHLNQGALAILRQLQAHGDGMADQGEEAVTRLGVGVDAFCAALLQRLDREEAELFAIARRALGGDVWLTLASQFWRHDAEVEERRRHARGPAALKLAPPPAATAAEATLSDPAVLADAAAGVQPAPRLALTLAG